MRKLLQSLCLVGLAAALSPAATITFSNLDGISIPDSGSGTPYPSTINVSGFSGTIYDLSLTLTNISHTFPDDIDILLVGPTGAFSLVMSDTGGTNDLVGVTYTFSPLALVSLTDSGVNASGTYLPTDFAGSADVFPGPAPAGPYTADFSVFFDTNPNGLWSLYVTDDVAADSGSIGSWSLTITDISDGGAVPEPASMALVGLGLVGIATVHRRRKRS